MASVTLRQGIFTGVGKGDVESFYGIPYAAPLKRFEAPSPPPTSTETFSAAECGAICPQSDSRLSLVMGPMPAGAGPMSETRCAVLSVHTPVQRESEALPVIVFSHGGAWITGGSQISWYDGTRLARDGHVVVVTINYRLGIFGFLPDENQPIQPGLLDMIGAYEWVHENISAFGGDPTNITAIGQSAGAANTAKLIQIRPDLFNRAIIQSAPGTHEPTHEDQKRLRDCAISNLPHGVTLETASIPDLLAAQLACIKSLGTFLPPFLPAVPSSQHNPPSHPKDILIGWTKDDGSCFVAMAQPSSPPSDNIEKSADFTKKNFEIPAIDLSRTLNAQGHSSTLYEITFSPQDSPLGATHCVDLPLLFGNQEAWREAPILGSTAWEEWDRRGRRLRMAWADFARDGTRPVSWEDCRVHG